MSTKIKVLTWEELKLARMESSRQARNMTLEEVSGQMRSNGSITVPNPWYRGKPKDESSFKLEP